MPDVIGTISLQLGIDRSLFDKQVNSIGPKTQKALGPVGVALGNMVAGMVQGAVSGIGKTIESCISLGSELSEIQNVVNVTFPTMSAQVDEWSKNAISSFGLSEAVSKRYISTLGTMATSFGFTEAEALGMSEQLTGLAGDMSSFYNIDSEQAFNELRGIFTGETEAIKSRGVVLNQAALDEFALAEGYGKSVDAMTEKEKVALRLAFVTSKLKNADGDFMRTSSGWANQTRVLSLGFDSLKASIGQGFIAMLTPIVTALNSFMGVLQQAADSFATFMQTVFNVKIDTSTATTSIGDGLEGVGDGADTAADKIKGIGTAAKAASKFLAGFDTITKISDPTSGSGSSGGSVGSSLPAPSDITRDTAISDSVTGLITSLEPLREAWDNLVVSLGPLVEDGKDFYELVLKPIGEWVLSEALPGFVNLLADFFTGLDPVIDAVVKGLADAWTNFFEPIASWVVGDGFDILGSFFIDVGNTFKENPQFSEMFSDFVGAIAILASIKFVAGGIISLLTALKDSSFFTGIAKVMDLAKAFGAANPGAASLLGTIGTIAVAFAAVLTGVVGVAGVVAGWDMTKIDSWIQGYKDTWAWVVDEVEMCLALLDDITGLPSALGLDIQPFNDQVKELPGLFEDAFYNITGGTELSDYLTDEYEIATGVWDGLTDFFTGAFEDAEEASEDAFDPIGSFFDGVYEGITSKFGELDDWFIELQDTIKTNIEPVSGWFSQFFKGVYLAIQEVIPLDKMFSDLKQGIVSNWQTISTSFGQWFGEAAREVSTKLNSISQFFTQLWGDLNTRFKTFGVQVGEVLGSAIKLVLNAALSQVEGHVNKAFGLVNVGLGVINDAIPGTKNDIPLISTVKIPRLANGGIISSPTLAMVGEAGREAIVPLENNTEWINKVADAILLKNGGRGSGDLYINSPIYMSDTGDYIGTIVKKIRLEELMVNG